MSKAIEKKTGLGKGFGSLLPDEFDKSLLLDKKDRVHKIHLADIKADTGQPRKHFDKDSLDGLASSIKTYGILQPLVVTPAGSKYIIVAGERRFRAAAQAGMSSVPALVRSTKELERLEIGLVENVQRVDLSPIEQAVSIAKLHEQFNLSYQDISERLGKAQTTISNIVRLLKLPKKSREALNEQKITEGHARSILSLIGNEEMQAKLLKQIITNGWSVRRAEQFAAHVKGDKGVGKNSEHELKIQTPLVEKISHKLNTKVTISTQKSGGKIQISYKSDKELQRLADLILK